MEDLFFPHLASSFTSHLTLVILAFPLSSWSHLHILPILCWVCKTTDCAKPSPVAVAVMVPAPGDNGGGGSFVGFLCLVGANFASCFLHVHIPASTEHVQYMTALVHHMAELQGRSSRYLCCLTISMNIY